MCCTLSLFPTRQQGTVVKPQMQVREDATAMVNKLLFVYFNQYIDLYIAKSVLG